MSHQAGNCITAFSHKGVTGFPERTCTAAEMPCSSLPLLYLFFGLCAKVTPTRDLIMAKLRKRFDVSALTALVVSAATSAWPAMGAEGHSPPGFGTIPLAPYSLQQCAPGNVSICGQTVGLPNTALGYSLVQTVPSPYVHQPFTVQCTSTGFQITDISSVSCMPLRCPASEITLCGAPVAVPGGTAIGNSIPVPVAVSVLADPSSYSDLSFTAQCVDDGSGAAVYQIADSSGISCNLFPCQNANIRLCDTDIPVNRGTPLGGILHLTMPPPFLPEPFTVQCVGSEGKAPVYQLTDVAAVSCRVDGSPR